MYMYVSRYRIACVKLDQMSQGYLIPFDILRGGAEWKKIADHPHIFFIFFANHSYIFKFLAITPSGFQNLMMMLDRILCASKD